MRTLPPAEPVVSRRAVSVSSPPRRKRARLPDTSRLGGVFVRLGPDVHTRSRRSRSRTWPAETFASLSPSHARSASIATTRRIRASATTPTGSGCASTVAGAVGTPAIGRLVSAGALLWPVIANAQSSAAPVGARRPGRARRPPAAPVGGSAGVPSRSRGVGRVSAPTSRRAGARGRRRRVRRRAHAGAGGVGSGAPADGSPTPKRCPRPKSRPRLRPRAISARTNSRSPRARRDLAVVAAAASPLRIGPRALLRGRQPRGRVSTRQLGRAAAGTVARSPPGVSGDRRRPGLRRDRRRLPRLG